jgi:hypothetical protein
LEGPKVRDHWEDLDVVWRITLRWTLGRQGSMGRTRFIWLSVGSSGGFFEHGDEPSGSIKKAGYCLTSLVTISFSENLLFHRLCK